MDIFQYLCEARHWGHYQLSFSTTQGLLGQCTRAKFKHVKTSWLSVSLTTFQSCGTAGFSAQRVMSKSSCITNVC